MANLNEIYMESLGMVSPGTDLPSLTIDPQDPTRKIAETAFRFVTRSLGGYMNWSFLQERRKLGETGRENRPSDPASADPPFDPFYQYRWPIVGEQGPPAKKPALPGFGRVSGVFSNEIDSALFGLGNFYPLDLNVENWGSNYSDFIVPVYRFASKYFYTNLANCTVLYMKRISTNDSEDPTHNTVNVDSLPDHFRTALIWGMASYLAMSEKSSLQLKAYAESKFELFRWRAFCADALLAKQENKNIPNRMGL